jgi:hypothetical protein
MKVLFIVGIILVLLLTGAFAVYKVYVSPSVEKPVVERPVSLAGSGVEVQSAPVQEHIEYISNELGAYKLHPDPISHTPAVIEFELTDTQEFFTVTVTNNVPHTVVGKATNPDIKIHTTKEILLVLSSTDDLSRDILKYSDAGKLWFEPVADEKTLALKGYKALYDAVVSRNSVTGQIIGFFK